MATFVPVNETNKKRIEDAVTAFCHREYGNEQPSVFDGNSIGVLYSSADFNLPDEGETEVGLQTDIVAKDGIYMWHAYFDDTLEGDYYEPLGEEEIEALANGSYDFDGIYDWMCEHLRDLVDEVEEEE